MTTVDRVGAPVRTDSVFFPGAAIAMALVVFVGFARSYYLKSYFHVPPVLSTLMMVHGVVFTCWMALLVTQTGLVATERRELHRSMGFAGVGIAVLMLVLGTALAIDALRRGFAPAGAPSAIVFFSIPIGDMVAFATLVGLGIANRAQSAFHKRYMLMSTAAILDAAIARIPVDFIETYGIIAAFALADLFIVALAIYDLYALKRIPRATLWSALIIVGSQVGRLLLSGTALWAGFATMLMR